jgi:pimeloyl-ACP methyl ester carboxylesterase
MSSAAKHTVVFIHGPWLHPQSWHPWVDLFEKNDYPSTAPAWPGIADTVEATRAHPNDIANRGIEEITDRYRQLISGMDRLPVVVGHSLGGVIAEKLLEEEQAAAAITVDSAQTKGVLPAPLSTLYSSLPVFKNPASRHQSLALSSEQFQDSFGNAIDAEESDELWRRWCIPAPGRPLAELRSEEFAAYWPASLERDPGSHGPLLMVLSGPDRSPGKTIRKAAAKQARHSRAETDVLEFADHGHLLAIDHGWQDVADACLQWLEQAGL